MLRLSLSIALLATTTALATDPQIIGEDGTVWTAPHSGLTQTTRYNPALGAGGAPHVAIVASADADVTDPQFTDPRDQLFATGLFASVTAIHAGLVTPSVEELKAFDAVLVWSNFDFQDPTALGDNLADYVDDPDGGGVVLAVFATTSDVTGRFLEGRWRDDGYDVISPETGNQTGQANLGTILDPLHPLVEGVGLFDGGISSFRPVTSGLHPSAVGVAEWTDGTPLVAYRDDLGQRRVDLGFYPPSDAVLPIYWSTTTDGDLLLANSVAWASGQLIADVRLQMVALTAPSAVDITDDPASLPGQLAGGVCASDFVLELWTSDVGVINTGVTGFYLDIGFDNAVLEAVFVNHGALFPFLQEGDISNAQGMITNFGGTDFTPHGVAPEWARLGWIDMAVVGETPTTITSSLGLGGLGVFGRPPPPLSQIEFGFEVCAEGQPCTGHADCADLDGDSIRDDNCVFWSCEQSTCISTDVIFADMGGQFGACQPDGTADNNDSNHAINCFADDEVGGGPETEYPCEEAPPDAYNVDTGGQFGSCAPDGVCDGNDAFLALAAFGGNTTCSCPLDGGPAPEPLDPVLVDRAVLSLHAPAVIKAGDVVTVDAMLDTPLDDLRGYQLHIAVSGGTAGDLELVDISIDGPNVFTQSADYKRHRFRNRRDDQIAAANYWSAYNTRTYQMLAGLNTAGVPVDDGYLATFTFRATPDAAGTFAIELLADDEDPAQRSFLFPTLLHGMIDVVYVKDAVIEIKR